MKLLNRWMIIFTLAGVIGVLFGCSKGSNGGGLPQVSPGLMPLSVGNYWQYSKIDYDSASGSPKDTVGDGIYIIAEEEFNNVLYFQQNQLSVTNINAPSYFINADSNTLQKVDSGSQYTFFKRVTTDSSLQDTWTDTVTTHCKGHNLLVGFVNPVTVDSYSCLRNEVQVADCTGTIFEKWEYYLKPGLGLIKIEHYKAISGGGFWMQFVEHLTAYHTD